MKDARYLSNFGSQISLPGSSFAPRRSVRTLGSSLLADEDSNIFNHKVVMARGATATD